MKDSYISANARAEIRSSGRDRTATAQINSTLYLYGTTLVELAEQEIKLKWLYIHAPRRAV